MWPVAIIWVITLPQEVASTGPATTSMPSALAVARLSGSFWMPPPPACRRWKSRPVSALMFSKTSAVFQRERVGGHPQDGAFVLRHFLAALFAPGADFFRHAAGAGENRIVRIDEGGENGSAASAIAAMVA
jgi:hypothetical protein